MISDLNVAVVAFNHISPFHLSIPSIVFAADKRPSHEQPWFNVRVCSIEQEVLQTNAGFSLSCNYGYAEISTADIIIVPSWNDPHQKPPEQLLETLRTAYQHGSQIVGLCLGAYVLAEAGLLNAKSATTHWAWTEDFKQRFPEIKLNTDALYIDQDQILTSAGVAAGIDCCLHIIRTHYGHSIANHVAKRLVVSPHREGNQTQFIEQPIAKSISDLRLSTALDSIRENLKQPYSLDDIAQQLCMSARSFTRQFKRLTGLSFNQWLLRERVGLVKNFLETTNHSIESIALQCGFNSSDSLRKQFNHYIGISPSNYRKTFKSSLKISTPIQIRKQTKP